MVNRLRPAADTGRSCPAQKRTELLAVTGLIEAGKLTPVVDRTYSLPDTAEGVRKVEEGHVQGKIIITT